MEKTKGRRPLADVYEKLYFHELEAREKLYSRLQVPMAVIISMVGLLGFMLQNLQRGQTGTGAFAFYASFFLSALFIFMSGFHLRNAAWGHEYAFLPTARAWDAYRRDCESTYKEFENADDLIEDALREAIYQEHIKSSSINAGINDRRSYSIYLAIRYLIIAVVFVFGAFVSFYFGGLDKTIHAKPVEVSIIKPVEMKGSTMSTDKPVPPPPPPPPTRFVRDDRPPAPTNNPPPDRKNGQ